MLRDKLCQFCREETGATAIEYGLICALVFLPMAAVLPFFANEVTTMFHKVGDAVMQVVGK